MVLGLKMKILTLAKKMLSLERVSKEEHNGANFSFVAPSSEELYLSPIQYTCMVKVVIAANQQ